MNVAQLLDKVKEKLNLKNDAALSRAMGVAPPVVSKLRNGRLPIGDATWLRLHEITGMRTLDLKAWASKDTSAG